MSKTTDTLTGATKRSAVATKSASAAQAGAATTGMRVAGAWKSMIGRAAGLAVRVAGLAAAFYGFRALKDAVSSTEDLAKTTVGLHDKTKLSIADASALAAVFQARGVAGDVLSRSLNTLQQKLSDVAHTGKVTGEAFKLLGIRQADIVNKPMIDVMARLADGFKRMKGTADAAKAAQALFGKGAKDLLPVLQQGSISMFEAMDLAERYGATLKGKTVKEIMELVHAQRESKWAMQGLSVTFGSMLAPMLTRGIKGMNSFILGFREGTGAGGQFRDIIVPIGTALKDTVIWLGKVVAGVVSFIGNVPGLREVAGAAGGVAVAFKGIKWAFALTGIAELIAAVKWLKALKWATVAAKVEMIALTAVMYAERVAMAAVAVATWLWTAAQWAVNVAMSANPIGLVIIGIAALVAAIVWVVTHWNQFKAAVISVWNFFQTHWYLLVPLLLTILAPIAAVALGFRFLRGVAVAVFNAVRAAIRWVIGALVTLWSWVSRVAGFVAGVFAGAFRIGAAALHGAGATAGWLGGALRTVWHWILVVANVVGGVFRGAWHAALSVIQAVGSAIHAVVDAARWAINAINDVANAAASLDPFGGGGGVSLGGGSADVLPVGHAMGGAITAPGVQLVGERGPELMHLPMGARIEPHRGGEGGGFGTIVTKVFLDKHQIAEAVHEVASDAAARA